VETINTRLKVIDLTPSDMRAVSFSYHLDPESFVNIEGPDGLSRPGCQSQAAVNKAWFVLEVSGA
jgi:hypothetical protein